MSDQDFCPSLADLLDSMAGDHVLEDHIAGCARCRALRVTMTAPAAPDGSGAAANVPSTAAADANAAALAAPKFGGTTGRLKPGQVITARYADLDEFLLAVVVDSVGNDPRVVPLGDDAGLATDLDLILDQVVLGFPAVAQAWNTGLLLIEQVHEVLGEVPADTLLALEALSAAGERAEPVPIDLTAGAPVLAADDTRLLAREEVRERVMPFWQPARLLADTPTFGALVRNARARGNVEGEDIAGLVDEPGWLERLEQDALNLESVVPSRMLLRLLDRLQVTLHEGTARLLGAAVAATCGPPPSQELRLARRRTGSARTARPSPEDCRIAAQCYIDALWREASRR